VRQALPASGAGTPPGACVGCRRRTFYHSLSFLAGDASAPRFHRLTPERIVRAPRL